MTKGENVREICTIINHLNWMNEKGFFILSQTRPKGYLLEL